MQPIVENCLKHGFTGFDAGGLVRISVVELDNSLIIEILDNGIGMDKEKVAKVNLEIQTSIDQQLELKGGIGLRNVYQRLRLFYQDKSWISIESSPMKGTIVKIYLPLA